MVCCTRQAETTLDITADVVMYVEFAFVTIAQYIGAE